MAGQQAQPQVVVFRRHVVFAVAADAANDRRTHHHAAVSNSAGDRQARSYRLSRAVRISAPPWRTGMTMLPGGVIRPARLGAPGRASLEDGSGQLETVFARRPWWGGAPEWSRAPRRSHAGSRRQGWRARR